MKLAAGNPEAQPVQEPEPDELTIAYLSGFYDGKKKRPWVGLTDDEIKHLYPYGRSVWGKKTYKAIEAKLKEKNFD